MRITKKDILNSFLFCYMVTDTFINSRLESGELSEEETHELKDQKCVIKECYKALVKCYFKISE